MSLHASCWKATVGEGFHLIRCLHDFQGVVAWVVTVQYRTLGFLV